MGKRGEWFVVFVCVAAAAAACGDASEPGLHNGRNAGGSDVGSAPPAAGGTSSTNGSTDPGGSTSSTPVSNQGCASCHGDANRTLVAGADPGAKYAPPRGTKGETASSTRAVGAHEAHLNDATSVANPVACTECHVIPTSMTHSNGVVEMAFGALARTGGVTPVFNGTTCASAYCHGNYPGGNVAAAPAWTGGAMTCTSCHGAPPSTGDHQRGAHRVACGTCHGNGYSATTVNRALHVNGVRNAGGAGSSITWNAATKSCTPQCHGTQTW